MVRGKIVETHRTVHEPEWLPEDTQAALEYMEYEESLCPGGCGFPKHESFDRANEDSFRVEMIACHACAKRQSKARDAAQSENTVTDGVFWVVHRDDDD